MHTIKFIAPVIAVLCWFSCKNGNIGALKGFIFERKALPGNKLFVAYSYKKGTGIVKDSCIIDNRIIAQDSINIGLLTENAFKETSK